MSHLSILPTRPDLISQAQMDLRAGVCRRCAGRSPGTDHLPSDSERPCESNCALFRSLADVVEVARLADPMVGSVSRTLEHYLQRLEVDGEVFASTRCHGRSPAHWAAHKAEIVGVIRNLLRE